MDGTGGDRELPVALGASASRWWSSPTLKHAPGLSPDRVPGPRAAHSCSLIGKFLYVFGGWNGQTGLSDLICLNTETLQWTVPSSNSSSSALSSSSLSTSPSPRNNHAACVYNSKLFIHGGHDGSKWLSDLHCFDTITNQWSQPITTIGEPVAPRACHTMTVIPGTTKVVFLGGFDGSVCFADLVLLDLESFTYTRPRVTGHPPQARNAQTVTPCGNNRLILFGGHSGARHLRDVHVLDTTTFSWSQPEIRGQIPPGLRGHTATFIGSSTASSSSSFPPSSKKILIFGGYDGRGRSQDLYLLDTDTFVFSRPAATGAAATTTATATTPSFTSPATPTSGGASAISSWAGAGSGATTSVSSSGGIPSSPTRSNSHHNNNALFLSSSSAAVSSLTTMPSDPMTAATNTTTTNTASSSTSNGPTGRQRHSACLVGGKKLFIIGGFDGDRWLSDVHILDVQSLDDDNERRLSPSVATLLRDFNGLVNNKLSFPDVCFIVEGTEIVAHKGILCQRSAHFNAMFRSPYREGQNPNQSSQGTGSSMTTISWDPECSKDAFLLMLEYLYTGSVKELLSGGGGGGGGGGGDSLSSSSLSSIAAEVMALGDLLGLDGLRILASTNLRQAIDTSSVCDLLIHAHRCGANDLKEECLAFLILNGTFVDLTSLKNEPELLLEVLQGTLKAKKIL